MNRQPFISRRAIALVLGCVSLAACNTVAPEPKVQIQRVEVPVAIKCSADPGRAPNYADSNDALRAAKDIFEQVRLLLAGRKQRMAREAELVAANAGCRAP